MPDRSFLEWPFFDESHRELADAVDIWASKNLTQLTENEHQDLDGTCKRIVAELGNAGFCGYAVPRSGGGILEKLDVRSLCLIRETLGRHHALADFAFAMQGLGSGPISLFGTPSQQERYLQPIATGNALSAFALSEPEAGSDVAAMAMSAELIGEE